jgi:hypothetical protein
MEDGCIDGSVDAREVAGGAAAPVFFESRR